MKILLFSRSQIKHRTEELMALRDAILQGGFDYAVNEEFATILHTLGVWDIPTEQQYGQTIGQQPESAIMVCYGGDGTLLEGAHRLGGAAIPILGINAGHLGFLTSVPRDGLTTLFANLTPESLRIEQRTMLQVEGDFTDPAASYQALNEFSIQRHGAGMISVETYVDEQLVATYYGDGVILSTPTGSTAYSLSAGGPVVAPTCACMVISPLAPHNLTMRPMVIPDSSTIRLRVHVRYGEAFATLDNRSYAIGSETEFTIRKSDHSIFLATPHNISFYDTLRNKMMWGVDIRG